MSILDRFKKKSKPAASARSGASRSSSDSSILRFYNECVEDYHKAAMEEGQAKNGLIFIPELIPIGEKTVLSFYKDPFYQRSFADDPRMLYVVIMSLSIQAGIVFAAKWHEDFSGLNDEYIDHIITDGPESECKPYLMQMGLTDRMEESAFYSVIFDRWAAKHEPYWKLRDPREYTFKATLAAYQLGVSMILGELGY